MRIGAVVETAVLTTFGQQLGNQTELYRSLDDVSLRTGVLRDATGRAGVDPSWSTRIAQLDDVAWSVGLSAVYDVYPVCRDRSRCRHALELAAYPGQRMLVYSAAPGSPSSEALDLLASWTAPGAQSEPTAEEKQRKT